MRISEDGIYRPPDMTEKSEGLHLKIFGYRLWRRSSLQTALHGSVVEASEEQEILRQEMPLHMEQLFTELFQSWKKQRDKRILLQ